MKIYWLLKLMALMCCVFVSNVFAGDWQKIEIPTTLTTVADENGQYRDIKPGCAFSYLPDGAGVPNQPFHFYYKEGSQKDRTLVYFNGGGACWNDATCLTSLVVGERPVYSPAIEAENSPAEAGGIFDLVREDNPVRNWNMVFIPYCTGDSHIGSRDSVYSDPLGLVNNGNPVIVQHRGFDNFMAVREWIKNNVDRRHVKQVMITGASAGSYGALLHFPRLYGLFPPRTKFVFLADAGVGVFTQPFIDLVFKPGGPWGVEDTLTGLIPSIHQMSSYNAEVFYQEILMGMASHFHNSQFALYTTAWDSIQTFFLNVMQHTDTAAGSVDPIVWRSIAPATWLEWHARMRNMVYAVSLNRNINYYIGAGLLHIGLIDLFKPETGHFYLENSAGNIFLTDWVKYLNTIGRNNKLPNLICEGDCGAPFPIQ